MFRHDEMRCSSSTSSSSTISADFKLLWSPGLDPIPCGGWGVGGAPAEPARQPLLMSAAAGPGDSALSCVPLTRKPPASAGHKAADQLKELNLNRSDDSFRRAGEGGREVAVGLPPMSAKVSAAT